MSLIEAIIRVTDYQGHSHFSVDYKTGKCRVPESCLIINRVAATIFKDETLCEICRHLKGHMNDVVIRIASIQII